MANSVSATIIQQPTALPDGTKTGVYTVNTLLTTDASGEFSAQLINKVTGDMGTNNKVLRVRGHLPGYSGVLLFDATTDVKFLTLPKDKDFDFNLRDCPIPNPLATGNTGDVLLTTVGAATVTGTGFILLEVKRNG